MNFTASVICWCANQCKWARLRRYASAFAIVLGLARESLEKRASLQGSAHWRFLASGNTNGTTGRHKSTRYARKNLRDSNNYIIVVRIRLAIAYLHVHNCACANAQVHASVSVRCARKNIHKAYSFWLKGIKILYCVNAHFKRTQAVEGVE